VVAYVLIVRCLFLSRLCDALSAVLKHKLYSSDDWLQDEVFCTPVKEDCMKGVCQECKNGQLYFFSHSAPADDEDEESPAPSVTNSRQPRSLHFYYCSFVHLNFLSWSISVPHQLFDIRVLCLLNCIQSFGVNKTIQHVTPVFHP
jgi:hypothetical protein